MVIGRRTRRLAATTLVLALVATGCGGGGGSDSSSGDGSGGSTTTTSAGTSGSTASLPPYTPDKRTFTTIDGSRARFVNLFVLKGEGTDLDVYWGNDADTGKKITTVPYGEASDWQDLQVPKDPYTKPADGSTEIQVAFYLKGKTDRESMVMNKQETLKGDMSLTYTMGWSKPFDETTMPGSLGVGYEHEAGKPPAGKAWVALNSGGIGGIEGGDFMVLSDQSGCQTLMGTDIEGGTANSGQAFLLDPGPHSFTASDANTDCSVKTPALDLDLKDGDRYVIYAYGTTKDDRKLLALAIDD